MTARAAAARRPRSRLTPRAVLLAIVVLALAIAAVVPLRGYLEQRSRMDALEREVQRLRGERVLLEQEVERLQDPAYLERLARECLGMVRPGEVAFAPVPADGERPLPPTRC